METPNTGIKESAIATTTPVMKPKTTCSGVCPISSLKRVSKFVVSDLKNLIMLLQISQLKNFLISTTITYMLLRNGPEMFLMGIYEVMNDWMNMNSNNPLSSVYYNYHMLIE